MAGLVPNFIQKFFDNNGDVLVGGKVYSYAAGTTTPLATYTDQTEGTANTNPIILDANGECNFWIDGSASYKFVVKDSADNVIRTVDKVAYLYDLSVTTGKIANGAVTTAKIADEAVTTAKIPDYGITTAKIADNAITTAKIPDGAVTPAKLESDFDFSQLTNAIECVLENTGDFHKGNGFRCIPQVPWSAPTLTTQPGTIPTGNAVCSAWSPNGEFLAVAHENSPYISVFERTTSTFIKVSDPSTLPGSNPTALSWSSNGEILAVAYSTDVRFYKRYGNVFLSLTSSSLAANIAACAFSPNGQFLAMAAASPQNVWAWEMVGASTHTIGLATDFGLALATAGGITYTDSAVNTGVNNAWATQKTIINTQLNAIKNYLDRADTLYLPNSGSISFSASPAGNCTGVSWSPDGTLLAFSHASSPYVTIYQRSWYTFTKLSDPANLPPGDATGVAFSPDGSFLVVTSGTTPYVTIYSVSGTTFTKLSDPATLPAGTAGTPAWSPNSKYLAIPHATSPYMTVYSRSGSTFTKLADPDDLPGATGSSAAWSPNGEFLSITTFGSPYIKVYQSTSILPTNALLWVRGVNRV